VWNLLGRLRDLCGKPVQLEEDRLRQSAPCLGQVPRDGGGRRRGRSSSQLQVPVTLAWRVDSADKRPLDLINKTISLILNGVRMGESEWQRLLERKDAIVAVVSYRDKLVRWERSRVWSGSQAGACQVSHWVMSCRAFSRRIEHHILDSLFRHTNAEEIEFTFEATERNQPLQEFSPRP